MSDLLPAVQSLFVCLLLCPRLLIHLPDFLLSTLCLPDLQPDVESLLHNLAKNGQTDDRISRVENALQQMMAATRATTAQGQQDLAQVRQELVNVQAGASAPPLAPAATELPPL
ncbi:unnamed protein product [Boreogadus saida]